MMSSIRGKDTRPERAIRQMLHALGLRFRLHRKDLPGRPDIVLPRHRLAILVHGCFWHRHRGCRFTTSPKTNAPFWTAKFKDNVTRDRLVLARLRAAGWRTLVVWECALKMDDSPKLLLRALGRAVMSDTMQAQIPRAVPGHRARPIKSK
jgi:DNA mismatch endonuclease (patch repair protein)